MFIRSLDEKEFEAEQMAALTGKPAKRIFPEDAVGQSMRWSKFKNLDAREIYGVSPTACSPSSRT